MNQLPEKLMKLRKHYRISQQQVASFCHVELMEYMGWENGRSVPNENQIKQLAELFHLSVEEIMNDSLDMPLLEVVEEVMEEIPVYEEKTREHSIVSEVEKTQVMKRISDADSTKKQTSEENKPWLFLKDWRIWAIAAGVFVLVLALVVMFRKPENTLNGIEVNNRIVENERLAAGKDFVLVLNEDGTVSARGNNDQGQLNVSEWSEIAQVSAGEAFSAGLKKDGTVVAAGNNRYGQTDIQQLTDIIEISAGAEHLAALKADGTVVCLGDNSEGQCKVSEWTNIVTVSASKSSTLGLTEDGEIVYAGKMDVDVDDFTSWTKIKKLYNGQTQVLALSEESKVYCTASSAYNVCQQTETWKDVISVKTSGNHAVALSINGRLFSSGDNSSNQGRVDEFKNIISIAAGPDFTVTLSRNNEVIGTGENDYQQFEMQVIEEDEPLQAVSDVTVMIEKEVLISWNEVSGAEYYTVSIPEIGYSANVADLSVQLALDRFVNESVYTVSITALTMDHSRLPSQETLVSFTFFAPEISLEPTPDSGVIQNPQQGTIVPTPTPDPTPTPEQTPEPTMTPEPTIDPTPEPTPEETEDPQPTKQPEDNQEEEIETE